MHRKLGSDQAADLPLVSQAEAARLLKVSERTVRSAKKVLDHGTPDLIEAVERGKVSVSRAAKEAVALAVRSRDEVVRVDLERGGIVLPGVADGLERCPPS
jgi:hypothetical protein